MMRPSQRLSLQPVGSCVGGLLFVGAWLAPAQATAAVCTVPSAGYATIQSAADDSTCDEIRLGEQVYTEQVTIGRSGSVWLHGAGAGRTIIRSPAQRVPSTLPTTYYPGYTYVIQVRPQTGVDITDLTVDGGGNSFCGEPYFGVRFNNAVGALDRVVVENVRSPGADFGCQNTVAVAATGEMGGQASVNVRNSTIRNFQKVGVLVNGLTAGGIIANSVIRGVGPNPYTAQNGIQFSRGGFGAALRNLIVGTQYTTDACNGMGSGILTYQAAAVALRENSFLDVDRAIYLQEATSDQTVTKNRVFSGSAGIVSDTNAAGRVLISANGITNATTNPVPNAAMCFPENGNGITVINESGTQLVQNSIVDSSRDAIALQSDSSNIDVQQNQASRSGRAEIENLGMANAIQNNGCRLSLPMGLCSYDPGGRP